MMPSSLHKLLFFCPMAWVCSIAAAQLPNYQLNRIQEADGLRTSDVIDLAKDKKGFIWIASQSNIYCFDGSHTISFPFTETINRIVIDAHDRKWAVTRGGIFLFDNDICTFRQIQLQDKQRVISNTLHETVDGAASISGNGEHYIFNGQQQKFVLHAAVSSRLDSVTRYFGRHGQSLFFGARDSVFCYNQQTKQVAAVGSRQVYDVVPLNDTMSLVSTTRFRTFRVNFNTGAFEPLSFVRGASVDKNLAVSGGLKLGSGKYLLSTHKGLFQYELATHSLTQPVFYYNGRPLENQQSVTTLYKDEEGNIFMNHADGIFILGSGSEFIQYLRNYSFRGIQLPSNDVRNFSEDNNRNIWMATTNGIARLNLETGELNSYNPLDRRSLIDFPSYRQLLYHGNYLWIGTSGHGVWYYDERTGLCRRPSFDASGDPQEKASFDQAYIWEILALANGRLLVVGGADMFIVDPRTLSAKKIDVAIAPAVSRAALQDSSGRIWHGTTGGLSCMDTAFRVLLQVRDSFPDKRVASFCEWKKNNMLVGSKGLFEIQLQGNTIISFKRKKAIAPERLIYCMKQDKLGFVWLGTDDGIFRYDPVKDESIMFDRSDHVQSQAFNSDAAFISSTGLLFMGGKNGVNYFNPIAFSPAPEKLRPLITSFAVNIDDSVYHTPGYKMPYSSRNIDFIISAPELKKPFRVQYRYRLRDNDQWTYTGFNNHIRISKLQPGDYSLQVSASYDGRIWFNGENAASFTVLKPWWQTWWFTAICIAAAALMAWGMWQYRRRKKAATAMKRTIEYFTYPVRADSSTGAILWDIASNCISRLGFEDCVIYLLNEEKNVLVQKAAYGAKSPAAYEIANPLEIPVGKGITGRVAQTLKATIVKDTSKNEHYIVDDKRRLSEITVPIIHHGKLIGVIDAEHSKKNFFTRHHLRTLEAISTLCASRIATALATEAAKKAESELLVLNSKITESKFVNLRLQMNPHFLFNILTSIQYLIVSNQVNKAMRYLDLFSGFLRSLLDHAEATVVTLDEELRILNMYVELESLCLDETFVKQITVAEELDCEDILVPFMLLQPFVENSINHGLVHKVGIKRFSITVKEHDQDSLLCIIEDNGIGRAASGAINRRNLSGVLHQSQGMGIVEKRLSLLQQKTSKQAYFEVEDLYENGVAAGTRIKIIIPYYSNGEL